MPDLRPPLALGLLLAAAATAAPLRAQRPAPATVVIVVRHAEKAAVPGDDPPLSAAGEQRARSLATALGEAGVTAVITSQWRRTGLTAAPLAAARGLTPTVVRVEGPGTDVVAAHARAVADAARRAGGTVLVVGHSNTVGPIVAALGGPAGIRLCDAQYATLHTVVPGDRAGAPGRVVRASYGAPDPAVDAQCRVIPPAPQR